MSYHEYKVSQEISQHDYPFYALIMQAMRQADSENIERLKRCWPAVWEELSSRYHAPEGILPGEEMGLPMDLELDNDE